MRMFVSAESAPVVVTGNGPVARAAMQLLRRHGATFVQQPVDEIGALLRETAAHSSAAAVGDGAAVLLDTKPRRPGGAGARKCVTAALRAGTHVVTADTGLVAAHGPALRALARELGVAFSTGPSVAQLLPALKAMRGEGPGGVASSIVGVLGVGGRHGDPEGRRTRDALAVMAQLLWDQDVTREDVWRLPMPAIDPCTQDGAVWRLVATARRGACLQVEPRRLSRDETLTAGARQGVHVEWRAPSHGPGRWRGPARTSVLTARALVDAALALGAGHPGRRPAGGVEAAV